MFQIDDRSGRSAAISLPMRWSLGLLLLVLATQVDGQLEPLRNAKEQEDSERYRVKIWVAVGDSPEVTEAIGDAFYDEIDRSLQANFGGAWVTGFAAVPRQLRPPIQRDGDLPTHAVLQLVESGLDQLNKAVVLGIDWNGTEYEIQAREFDTRVQQWTVSEVATVLRAKDVLPQAVASLIGAFAQVGTIGKPVGDQVDVQMYAGVYSDSIDSPLMPQAGDLMQVVIRRRRSRGDVTAYEFSVIPWTLLEVQATGLGTAQCKIHSGLRSPLRVRGISRTDRLAIVVNPRFASTTLRVHAKQNPQLPLSGYQIYAKRPGEAGSVYVGQSDWQGLVELPRDRETPLKVYYVKHGSVVLARLPIVAGLDREVSVEVPDDEQRLRAEGTVKGIQDRLIDTLRVAKSIRHEFRDDWVFPICRKNKLKVPRQCCWSCVGCPVEMTSCENCSNGSEIFFRRTKRLKTGSIVCSATREISS